MFIISQDTTTFFENIISYLWLKINNISVHQTNELIPFERSENDVVPAAQMKKSKSKDLDFCFAIVLTN